MPIREGHCTRKKCSSAGATREWYEYKIGDSDPKCPECGGKMKRAASAFGVVFTGALSASKYNDSDKMRPDMGAHWAYRKRSAKDPKKPEPVYIETFDQQARFCKEEGLINPKDMPANLEVSADGRSVSTRGMKGQWI